MGRLRRSEKRKDLAWLDLRKRNDEMMFMFVDRGKVPRTTRNYLRIVRLKFGANASGGSTSFMCVC